MLLLGLLSHSPALTLGNSSVFTLWWTPRFSLYFCFHISKGNTTTNILPLVSALASCQMTPKSVYTLNHLLSSNSKLPVVWEVSLHGQFFTSLPYQCLQLHWLFCHHTPCPSRAHPSYSAWWGHYSSNLQGLAFIQLPGFIFISL